MAGLDEHQSLRRGKTIVTLTLNPAIDAAVETERVQPTHKVRTTNPRLDPGGGGINVARVIQELGGTALAVYLSGGITGPVFDALLAEQEVACLRVPIAEGTRLCQVVRERSTGLEYRFVPVGPTVHPAELQQVLASLEELAFDYLVASGSVPAGVPADVYARVSEIAERKKARLVLDTSGEALRAALAGRVFLAKPSLRELEGLVGRTLPDRAAQEAAAREIVQSGRVEALAVTLGVEGALLVSATETRFRRALPVKAISAVGAGDSFVAAMTLGCAMGWPLGDAFDYGMAAGTAAVLQPATELCRRQDVERLLAQIRSEGQPEAAAASR